MLLGFISSKTRSLFVRSLHVGKKFTSPSAEDIIFKALCLNIKQKKWEFLNQLSSTLTISLLPHVSRELQSSPQLLLELYQRVGGKTILCSLESCCILIHFMVKRKNFDDALWLMKELMKSKGYSPLEVLDALISGSDGYFSSSAVFDALVRACTQLGATEDAYEVIKKLRKRNNRVSIHAWNNFLNHLLKIGDVGRFWLMYREMVSFEYYENVNTFNLLIYALCKECKLSEALSVFYRMLKCGTYPNIVGFNMLIDGACKADDLDLASNIVKKVETMSRGFVSPNVVSYNCLINGYCKRGNPEIAEQILGKMIEMGLEPNVRTYATVVDGYSRNGSLEEGFRLCDEMVEKSLNPNSVVYNSFIHWLYMEGDISGASLLLSNMVENQIPPDQVTYSTIIKGLCRNGLFNEALKVHNWIVDKNLLSFSHNALMDYLLSSNHVYGAEQLLCNMFVRGLVPDIVTYGTIIDGYCKYSKTESAVEVYTDTIKTEKTPDLVTFNSLLDGFCKEGSLELSESLIDEMKRLNMFDTVSLNTLLNCYWCSGKVKEAFGLFTSMRKIGFLANKVTYNIMINYLCKFGLFKHAKQVLSVMISQGINPDVITCTVLMTNLRKKCSSKEVVEMHGCLVRRGSIPDSRAYEAIVCLDTENTDPQFE